MNATTRPPLDGAAAAVTDALTDGMVERLVTTGANGLELLDRLNDPDTRAAVHRLLDGLTTLHNSGGLDTLFEIAAVAHAARSAASDSMVERLTEFAESMVTNMATPEIAELARDTERALYDAQRCCDAPDAPKSLWGVIKYLFKPETVRMLYLAIAFGRCWQDNAKTTAKSMVPVPNQ
ncbi:hypothetical protein [Magnetospirillum fulvum]|uniref:DUF1641 domain-containing protein n=1 Tax=Magnetospirillum fulvum TaxID=1082 RepID=A0A1H6HW82_MAGFU|nr:hypothetical protein [Magnetospirillum fulvum]SEH40421.1 hypothetical protein SAMN04244559_02134 [Magnetospirillum fulvum]